MDAASQRASQEAERAAEAAQWAKGAALKVIEAEAEAQGRHRAVIVGVDVTQTAPETAGSLG